MITAANWLGIDDSHIKPIGSGLGLMADTFSAFSTMQKKAQHDGIDIQIVSGFRSFERQLAIWQMKWNGQRPLYSLNSELIDFSSLSEIDRLHAIMTWSALPGASRHHWGTDFDVYDKQSVESSGHKFELISPEYQENGVCYELNCWLAENANQFGFSRPYHHYSGGVAPEPWHLSYQPIATEILKALDLELLCAQIQNVDIGGKELILANLESLFIQYTLNGKSVNAL